MKKLVITSLCLSLFLFFGYSFTWLFYNLPHEYQFFTIMAGMLLTTAPLAGIAALLEA